MRYVQLGAGFVGVVLIAANFAVAGPFERDATSKARGDFTGRGTVTNNQYNQTYRAFSYQPQVSRQPVAQTPAAATPAKPKASTAQKQNTTVRSFSYQAVPTRQYYNYNTQNRTKGASYLNADHKALGQY